MEPVGSASDSRAGSIPGRPHTFLSPSADSREGGGQLSVFGKSIYRSTGVNRLGGLSLPRMYK